jgi:hypothetical protein
MTTPLSGFATTTPIEVAGLSTGAEGLAPDGVFVKSERTTFTNRVTPDWFRTLGTPSLAGRDFTAADGPGAPAVMGPHQALDRDFRAVPTERPAVRFEDTLY